MKTVAALITDCVIDKCPYVIPGWPESYCRLSGMTIPDHYKSGTFESIDDVSHPVPSFCKLPEVKE